MAKGSDNIVPQLIITEGSAPSTSASGTYPGIPSGDQALYIDSTNHHLSRVDHSGTTKDLEGSGGSGAVTQLYDSTAGGNVASFNPTGLSGAYTSLLVHFTLRCDQGSNQVIRWQFHADTGAHYDWDIMYGGAGGDAAAGSTGDTSGRFGEVEGTGSAANKFTIGHLWLPNYANTATDKGWQGMCHNTGLLNEVGMGVWAQTNAIDSIKCFPAAGNFVANSRFTVWGIL